MAAACRLNARRLAGVMSACTRRLSPIVHPSRRAGSGPACSVMCARSVSTASACSGRPVPAEFVSVAQPAQDVHKLGYFTDVEGHSRYLDECVAMSDVVDWADDTKTTLNLRPHCMFVYGGDAFDKGTADLRIATALADLRERHPDRVFLLIGNRDLNKMKLSSELADSDLARPIDDIPKPYWVSPGTSLRTFLTELHAAEHDGAKPTDEQLEALNTGPNRLRYLHTKQMGCFYTFDFRRQEMARERGCDPEAISDDEVFENFRHSVAPGGPAMRYLSNAQLAVVVGDTLFVHGAINEHSMGFLPDADVNHDRLATGPPPGLDTTEDMTVVEWITKLNKYATEAVADWVDNPTWDDQRKRRGGQALMGYGYRPAMQGRTAMVQSYMGPSQHPAIPDPRATRYLTAGGIHRVIAGHQPFGDSPLVMRLPTRSMEVITADTSFSDPEPADRRDTRGVAASCVHVHAPLERGCSYVCVAGRLHDGTPYDFELPPPSAGATAHDAAVMAAESAECGADCPVDGLIGLETRDGWWVKARVDSPDGGLSYVLNKGEGFIVHQRREPTSVVLEEVVGGSTLKL